MKKLLLIRHAKAASYDGKDFKRPLSEKGVHDAHAMATELKKLQLVPGFILTSPAHRAKATAEILSEVLAVGAKGNNDFIYEANTHTLLNIVAHLPDEHNFVALVGHNPGLSQLLYELTGEVLDMPTMAAVLIGFDFDEWDMVSSDTGKVAWYGSPKNH